MDVDRVMLPNAFDVYAMIGQFTPVITHPETMLDQILDLPNRALFSDNEEIINVHNDCGNDDALSVIMEHTQSSIDV